METPVKRQPSEVEAELRLALQETGVDLSSVLETYFSKLDTPVSVEKVARWFVSTRALRSQISRRKSALIDAIERSTEPVPEAEETVHARLQKAGGVNITSSDFSWRNLKALYSTEHACQPDDEQQTVSPPLEVNVNSGGVVYFAVFQQSNGREAAACVKFTPSRLTTQSERLGYEIARHLGVETPQARVIRSESEEWTEITEATERLKQSDEHSQTCEEMLEALELNRCLLLMGYVDGCPLHKYKHASLTQHGAQKMAAALGRVLLLDLVLRNEDRLPCNQLGWRGNTGNLLCTERQPVQDPVQMKKLELKLTGRGIPSIPKPGKMTQPVAEDDHTRFADTNVHLVAIDSGVPRRPPTHKRELDKLQYPRFVEMVLNDWETASEVLGEVSGECLKSLDGEFDQVKITNAFKAGFRAALKDMSLLRTFLVKLQRRLDYHLKQFVADINENLPADWTPDKPSSPMSNSSSPASASPHSKLERRFTLKLKDFNKLAKVDDGIHDRVEHWDELLGSEGHKLCETHGFVTGFLEGDGQHSVVDSYELKIRVEHVLERMELITQGSETERPSQVLDSLYVGGAFAAKSFNILERIGITHILCLCPIEVGSPDPEVLQLFEYKSFQVLDIEEEDISSRFPETSEFLQIAADKGGKALVHCFEGKSRSPTVVLAYLMMKRGYTLMDAWNLLKGVHPRSQPNDSFMRALVELDKQLHGRSSMEWQNKKPVPRLCPVCEKNVGISSDSLQNHLRKFHPESAQGEYAMKI